MWGWGSKRVSRPLTAAIALVLALPMLLAGLPIGTSGTAQAQGGPVPIVVVATNDTSPPLSVLAAQPDRSVRRTEATTAQGQPRFLGRRPAARSADAGRGRPDAALQAAVSSPDLPPPLLTFEGVADADNVLPGNNGCGGGFVVAPADQVGDVGPNHYIEMTNCVMEIFSKSGTSLPGPIDNNTVFTGFPGACGTFNDGDLIVLYDPLADRWLLSQFALPSGGPSHECVAISATSDPTGPYHRYDFSWPLNKCNDYPKLGVWPDAYYISANPFNQAGTA